jgi:hypothetical protein
MSSVALYQALKAAGVDDVLAERAAAEIGPAPDLEQFASKADLRAAVAELRAEMSQQTTRIVGILAVIIGLVATAAKLL